MTNVDISNLTIEEIQALMIYYTNLFERLRWLWLVLKIKKKLFRNTNRIGDKFLYAVRKENYEKLEGSNSVLCSIFVVHHS